MWSALQELATSAPKMLVYVFALFALVILLGLAIALRRAPAECRPEIIRALADLLAFWRRR